MNTIKTIIITLITVLLSAMLKPIAAQSFNVKKHLNNTEHRERFDAIQEDIKAADETFSQANSESGNRAYRGHRRASKTYDINYRSLYLLLSPYLDEFKEKADEDKRKKIRILNYTASDKLGMAITQRRLAADADKSQAVGLYKKAHQYDKEAQNALFKAFAVYYDEIDMDIPEDDPYTIAALEKRKDYNKKDFKEINYEISKPEDEEKYKALAYKNPTAIESADSKHTYSVQIASAVEPEDISYLRKRYPNAGEIREEITNAQGDPFIYKYTYGNFNSYRKASQAADKSGVKGAFVVAYNKKRRLAHISDVLLPEEQQTYITEKIDAISTGHDTNEQPDNQQKTETEHKIKTDKKQGTEYRVQIGTSRLPATREQIDKMNKTNLPVKTNRSENLYKYSVGSFKSYEAAKSFIKSHNLAKAFVVKYQDGRQVKI